MTQLRPYQSDLIREIRAAWGRGSRNVLAVMPTGAGKTLTFSHVVRENPGGSVVFAHRSELVTQISLALARNGVAHRVIAPAAVQAECDALHLTELGRRWRDPQGRAAVAGVHTFVGLKPGSLHWAWLQTVTLWIVDEAHHLSPVDNVWGRAVAMLPNARGLGVTATPCRADGRGLGRHADGLMDEMVIGPSMSDLMDAGYLCRYRILVPPSDIDLSGVAIGNSGDYVGTQLRAAVHKSRVTGDIVQHYLKHAAGKLGITFTVDVEEAEKTSLAFRAAGVPSEVLTGKTPGPLRARVMRRFRAREVLQIVNCDLLGEGTDVPGIEVVSFGRPTASYGLYMQQAGRALRPLPGKDRALILDHVGNVLRHGLPDTPRAWTLDRRERASRAKSDTIPLTSCPQCAGVYERVQPACPYCGYAPEPVGRAAPEQVLGDLQELDATVLEALLREIGRIDGTPRIPQHLDRIAAHALKNRHLDRQRAQEKLRAAMAAYGGWREAEGDSLRVAQRRFFLTYGVDVLTAQTLGSGDAETLLGRLTELPQIAATLKGNVE